MVEDGEELIEFYHQARKMEYKMKLQKDKTGQHHRLTRRFLHKLKKMADHKLELVRIAKAMKCFFQKPT